jgi:hypothetical protein
VGANQPSIPASNSGGPNTNLASKRVIDTRGKNDVESPLGEWTRVECICRGDRITVLVNGKEVNECYAVWPTAGKILIESEGFEILFRKIELRPL